MKTLADKKIKAQHFHNFTRMLTSYSDRKIMSNKKYLFDKSNTNDKINE